MLMDLGVAAKLARMRTGGIGSCGGDGGSIWQVALARAQHWLRLEKRQHMAGEAAVSRNCHECRSWHPCCAHEVEKAHGAWRIIRP